jgi:DNA invertase Pin-like site-specific DNA recombinase
VFREVASGARADRPGLPCAIAQLEEGDVLMVMRLDRLARSTRNLLNTLAAIAEKNAGFRLSQAFSGSNPHRGHSRIEVFMADADDCFQLLQSRFGGLPQIPLDFEPVPGCR